jgi:hypothetical protein
VVAGQPEEGLHRDQAHPGLAVVQDERGHPGGHHQHGDDDGRDDGEGPAPGGRGLLGTDALQLLASALAGFSGVRHRREILRGVDA